MIPAITIEITMALTITTTSPADRLQTRTARAVVSATATPLISPTLASFQTMCGQ